MLAGNVIVLNLICVYIFLVCVQERLRGLYRRDISSHTYSNIYFTHLIGTLCPIFCLHAVLFVLHGLRQQVLRGAVDLFGFRPNGTPDRGR